RHTASPLRLVRPVNVSRQPATEFAPVQCDFEAARLDPFGHRLRNRFVAEEVVVRPSSHGPAALAGVLDIMDLPGGLSTLNWVSPMREEARVLVRGLLRGPRLASDALEVGAHDRLGRLIAGLGVQIALHGGGGVLFAHDGFPASRCGWHLSRRAAVVFRRSVLWGASHPLLPPPPPPPPPPH